MANVASLKAINAHPQEAKGKEIGDWLEAYSKTLILEGDLPLSDQLKLQQATGSVLRDHFRGGSL